MSHVNPITVLVKELSHSIRTFRRLVVKDGRISEYRRREAFICPSQQRKLQKIERVKNMRRHQKERRSLTQ